MDTRLENLGYLDGHVIDVAPIGLKQVVNIVSINGFVFKGMHDESFT